MVIIVFGLPGSGKSIFAERLASMLHASYISSDKIRKDMYTHPSYTAEEKHTVYKVMLDKMRVSMEENRNVILDGTFYSNEIRSRFIEATAGKIDLFFIEVTAEESVVRARLASQREFSDADLQVYMHINKLWEPLDEPHLMLRSDNSNLNELLEAAKAYYHLSY